jgi:O-acetyl-ADP-ribose deacetylase (regulator of RNase III)
MSGAARTPMEVVEADITQLEVDAIVNAANSSLLGGGGVDGAIHRVAGPGLLAECRQFGGCEPGDAKVTGGHRLPARWVIHTVGPKWRGGDQGEPATLASCYRRCLEEAHRLDARSIAFPGISTGVYGYPIQEAAAVAVGTVRGWLDEVDHELERVIFCTFGAGATAAITRQLEAV